MEARLPTASVALHRVVTSRAPAASVENRLPRTVDAATSTDIVTATRAVRARTTTDVAETATVRGGRAGTPVPSRPLRARALETRPILPDANAYPTARRATRPPPSLPKPLPDAPNGGDKAIVAPEHTSTVPLTASTSFPALRAIVVPFDLPPRTLPFNRVPSPLQLPPTDAVLTTLVVVARLPPVLGTTVSGAFPAFQEVVPVRVQTFPTFRLPYDGRVFRVSSLT